MRCDMSYIIRIPEIFEIRHPVYDDVDSSMHMSRTYSLKHWRLSNTVVMYLETLENMLYMLGVKTI